MPESLQHDDSLSSLERAREGLYAPGGASRDLRPKIDFREERNLPHAWGSSMPLLRATGRHVRLAGLFFVAALLFFLVALAVSAYFLYFGGNAVSVNNVSVTLQGPTTVAGGDTLPLSLSITNRNSVPLDNATLEVDFPAGTRSADNVLADYPRYTENLGTLAPGATITRSVRAIIFGGDGQSITLPVSLSYSTSGSSAVFVKKTSYALAISTTPLSISVDAPAEAVSGQPFTLTLIARSNAPAPLDNVMIAGTFPQNFSVSSSSVLLQGSSILLGTLAQGESRSISITGTLTGQALSPQTFHFAIGTVASAGAPTLALSYMQQDATVTLAAPFISTTLALNGDTSGASVVSPGARQSVTLTYANTLDSAVTDASIDVTLSGAAIDYSSIQTSDGFYQSSTHSIIFDRTSDASLASLAPGASGIGTFTFLTLPSGTARDPLIVLTTSVSGTRVGQSNVPEQVTASNTTTAKVATALTLSANTLHTSGFFANGGPIPPAPGSATTYAISWQARSGANSVAGASVSATLPVYVSYTGKTSGEGSFSYDPSSRTVSWAVGDLAAGAVAQSSFQVSFTPSLSQEGSSPALTSAPVLTGFDRYAQVQVTAQANPSTTETPADPGYVPADASVH